MQWSDAQQEVLDHRIGRLRAGGGAGTGKTTVLVERWHRRAETAGAERILVLCRSRSAAERFRQSVLVTWQAAASALPITTWYGAAFDLVRRHRGDRRLLTRAEQWALVRRLLAEGGPTAWPSCPEMAVRAAFVDEVASAVLAVETAGLEAARAAPAAGGSEMARARWSDLLAFCRRYQDAATAMGALDGPQLLNEAAELLSDAELRRVETSRWDEVLIDDAEVMTPAMGRIIDRLAPDRLITTSNPDLAVGSIQGQSPAWFNSSHWDTAVVFGPGHRPALTPALLRCRHPASEPDAIAGALLQAHDDGVDWAQMAVLVRRERPRAQAIGRALVRHGIPVRVPPGSPAAEPAVRAILDFLAWAAGDDAALDRLLVSPALDLPPGELARLRRSVARGRSVTDDARLAPLVELRDRLAPQLDSGDPAGLAYQVWATLLGGLIPEPDRRGEDPAGTRALEAVVAYLAAVSQRVANDARWRVADELALVEAPDFDPEPWLVTGPVATGAVTLTGIAAAGGWEWDTVVLAGCLEGELPRISASSGFFDRTLLTTGLSIPPPAARRQAGLAEEDAVGLGGGGRLGSAERRKASLAEEGRLFALATSRATRRLIATAAPRPGQLVSRFVAGAPAGAARPLSAPVAEGSGYFPAPETVGLVPVHPQPRLVLSASQLTTYDDCPLRYGYQYALGIRSVSGVAAEIGSIVHEALARYLDPAGPADASWERLEVIAESLWSDDIAPYRPMREQARRDIFTMVRDWWEAEPALSWPDVLAVEYPFEVAIGDHRIRGYIDRIDRVDGGIAIIDYKTGGRMAKIEAMAEDLQLATYHLAAVRDPQLVAFGPPMSLQLRYLRKGERREQAITADHAQQTEARILDTAARILREDFEPSVEADCEYCDFRRLCPLQVEGRQVGYE